MKNVPKNEQNPANNRTLHQTTDNGTLERLSQTLNYCKPPIQPATVDSTKPH